MIYSCFPTTGKSYLAKHLPNEFVDLESSKYQWLDYDPSRVEPHKGSLHISNPAWPDNYVRAIVQAATSGRNVLISSQPSVLDSLQGLEITYVYYKLTKENKDLCRTRMNSRGNSKAFIKPIMDNFYKFNSQLKAREGQHIELDVDGAASLSYYLGKKSSMDDFIDYEQQATQAIRPYDEQRHVRNTLWYNRLERQTGKTAKDMANYLGMPEQKVIDVIYGALDASPEDTHRVEALLNDTVGPYNSWN